MKNYITLCLALGLFISGLVAFNSNVEAQPLHQNALFMENGGGPFMADAQGNRHMTFENRGYHMDSPRHYSHGSNSHREAMENYHRSTPTSREGYNRDSLRHRGDYQGHGPNKEQRHWRGENHWGNRGEMRHHTGWGGNGEHGQGRHHRR